MGFWGGKMCLLILKKYWNSVCRQAKAVKNTGDFILFCSTKPRSVVASAFVGIVILGGPFLVTWRPSSSVCPPEEEKTAIASASWSLCCVFLKAGIVWLREKRTDWKSRGVKRQFLGLTILLKKPWNIMILKLENAEGKKSGTPKDVPKAFRLKPVSLCEAGWNSCFRLVVLRFSRLYLVVFMWWITL